MSEWVKRYYFWVLGLIALVCSYVVFSFYFNQFNGPLSGNREVWGQFGDFIGGTLNPILAFVSLLALLITIQIQNKELAATRAELELTRLTIQDQTSIQDDQREQMEKQFFDNHFFNTLELLQRKSDALANQIQVVFNANSKHYAYIKEVRELRAQLAQKSMLRPAEIDVDNNRQNIKFWDRYSGLVNGLYVTTIEMIDEINNSHDPGLYMKKLKSVYDADDLELLGLVGVLFYEEGLSQLDRSLLLRQTGFKDGQIEFIKEYYPISFNS